MSSQPSMNSCCEALAYSDVIQQHPNDVGALARGTTAARKILQEFVVLEVRPNCPREPGESTAASPYRVEGNHRTALGSGRGEHRQKAHGRKLHHDASGGVHESHPSYQ